MISRRHFVAGLAGSVALTSFGRVTRHASRVTAVQQRDSSNLFAMDQAAARTVRLAPKPGATPSMTVDERDALEHRIRCQCGCTLDVFTCRTTDFACQVSPAMHRDIMALVAGGYSATEITDAFVRTYGEAALMAPPRKGFNIVGYVVPGIVIGIGAIVLAAVLRGMKQPAAGSSVVAPPDATSEEVARINAALRDDA